MASSAQQWHRPDRRHFIGGSDVMSQPSSGCGGPPAPKGNGATLILRRWIAAILPRPIRCSRLSLHDSRRLPDESSPAKVLADG